MATESTPTASLRIRRVFKAPREAVFRAWTDPEALKVWFVHPDYEVPAVTVDLRVGGRYAITLRKLPDGEPFDVSGTYREVILHEKLVFTWAWSHNPGRSETVVTVEFREAGEATEVVLSHDLFRVEATRDEHRRGWGICLDGLDRYLAA
jgi:uncharacterized protein YndB with AHSA1/START domain